MKLMMAARSASMSKTYLRINAAFFSFNLASPLWPGGDQNKTSYGLILHFRSHLIWGTELKIFLIFKCLILKYSCFFEKALSNMQSLGLELFFWFFIKFAGKIRDLARILKEEGCDCSKIVFNHSFWHSKVTSGVLKEEALEVLQSYFKDHKKG